MADDIVTRLRAHRDIDNDRCCECGHWTSHDDDCMIGDAADEIERLRAMCNDLHHDATCVESFCRLCGEGVREWEARHEA